MHAPQTQLDSNPCLLKSLLKLLQTLGPEIRVISNSSNNENKQFSTSQLMILACFKKIQKQHLYFLHLLSFTETLKKYETILQNYSKLKGECFQFLQLFFILKHCWSKPSCLCSSNLPHINFQGKKSCASTYIFIHRLHTVLTCFITSCLYPCTENNLHTRVGMEKGWRGWHQQVLQQWG